MEKNILKSKTFWISLLVALSPLVPGLKEWISSNPESFSGILGAVFASLRLVTNSKVSLI
ncbi:MAG TPA: hypothetical protein VMW10_06305 [Alphaproteobacteria bacterium]|nr:hypothetical protein [Alphaproteobacteria bacterium]